MSKTAEKKYLDNLFRNFYLALAAPFLCRYDQRELDSSEAVDSVKLVTEYIIDSIDEA